MANAKYCTKLSLDENAHSPSVLSTGCQNNDAEVPYGVGRVSPEKDRACVCACACARRRVCDTAGSMRWGTKSVFHKLRRQRHYRTCPEELTELTELSLNVKFSGRHSQPSTFPAPLLDQIPQAPLLPTGTFLQYYISVIHDCHQSHSRINGPSYPRPSAIESGRRIGRREG